MLKVLSNLRSYIYIYILVVISFFLINSNLVYAEDKSSDINLDITPTLEVNIPSSVDLSITPTTDGVFSTANLDIIVGTNNPTGYNLSMEVANNTLFNASYPDDTNATIPSITTPTTELNFPLNTWGYSEDNGTSYLTVTSKSKMVDINHAINESITNLKFATKININKPSGTYSGTVKIIVVTNRTPMNSLAKAYEEFGKTKISVGSNEYYKMQDMNANICDIVTLDEEGLQVVDTRDNSLYRIAKLKDNRCWMLDNLALDLTNSTVLNSLTDTNTNASSTSLISLKSGNRSAGYRYATAGVTNWTSLYSYSAPLVNISNKDVIPSDSLSTAGNWKVGGYYNYCAASAGSYCYGYGTSEGTSSGNATESICPAGWRLPTGNYSGEYQALYTAYSSNYTNFRNAFHFPLSGYLFNGSVFDQGSNGYFWSSALGNDRIMLTLFADTSDIDPSHAYGRISGLNVRCMSDTH